MTPKQIQYSDHAVSEMRKALPPITRQMVRSVLERGQRKVESRKRSLYWSKAASIGELVLEVVFLEHAQTILVITVYWLGRYD